ncbi:carbon starvation protein A [Methanospirillum purgamenti]|uniref:Carbon starvation protein A n=1 Tax=Methanospirillum hungatei TaxID=2203 RepID=A0A8F5VMI1_METHU|nr:carbon starvation protein A [Methanospirillum hungatei]QXO95539.1 carbon starvation protein A [Methanospirillum hungatei]
MNAIIILIISLCIFALAYRYYGLFIATRVLELDENRETPAESLNDMHDFHPTNKFVLFGHHFAAIAGAGPLIGPVLAAQFGYLPGLIWILIGAVVAGAVHDMVVLFASARYDGKSLSLIASELIGKRAGLIASLSILFILMLTLAGLSLAVVKALYMSPVNTFTVLVTIPIALLMGIYLYRFRPDDILGASLIGLVLLLIVILAGPFLSQIPIISTYLTLGEIPLRVMIPVYGFIAAALPVWLLLCPRNYLSTFLKIGTIVVLAIGVFIIHPEIQMPAVTEYFDGGGPVIPGSAIPFLFITIACGALSGFHSTIGTGTTPKMIANERDIYFVGYGAMLMEGFVAIMALIVACSLIPADYFAINVAPAVYSTLGMVPVQLPELESLIGESLTGRTGGAVALAVGMASIFARIPYFEGLLSYWYHFAIMFEAVFVLTAIDTGTRVGRYLLQELFGQVIPKFHDRKWIPGVIITGFVFTFAWGYLLYTGEISTIWPLFGMSNQLLAATGLIIGTTLLIKMGKRKYMWITAIPGLAMIPITFYAGYLNILNYLQMHSPQGYLLTGISIILMILLALVLFEAIYKWYDLLVGEKKDPRRPTPAVLVQ